MNNTVDFPIKQLTREEFPPLLNEIPDAPKTLYLRGKLPPKETRLLAVVGSRKYSAYGKAAVSTLIGGLAGYPIAIVSGLALGIDALAHEAALAARLPAIAVPGSGLSDHVLYPSTNRPLARKILSAGGALLSEFAPDFRATPFSFPERNRIMAGLSHAVLVIEATQKSGTLITARLTAEYNRELLVVPGSIFSPGSFGPHLFLSLGATPARSSSDILRALGIAFERPPLAQRADVSDTEGRALALLETPKTRDELIASLALPTRDAQVLLSAMELKGFITERLGKICRA